MPKRQKYFFNFTKYLGDVYDSFFYAIYAKIQSDENKKRKKFCNKISTLGNDLLRPKPKGMCNNYVQQMTPDSIWAVCMYL